MVAGFGPFADLFFCMFYVPSHHPFRATGFIAVLKILLSLVTMGAIPLVICTLALLWAAHRLKREFSLREFIRRNDWTLFLLVGLCNIPTSVLGNIKYGGDVHNFSYLVYFVAIGALLVLRQEILRGRTKALRIPAMSLALAALVLYAAFLLPETFKFYRRPPDFRANPTQLAYDFAIAHPGEAYFPWNPVVGFLTDHKLYNCDWGVLDWALAGKELSLEEFRAGIPPQFNIVAYPPNFDSDISLQYLNDFSDVTSFPELPRFEIFRRPGE
jgi:hypothetical protein